MAPNIPEYLILAYISGYRGGDASICASAYAARYPEANTLLKEVLFVFFRTMGC